MNTNVTSLIGATLTTSRDLTVDSSGMTFEAKRRNPAPDDMKLPAGTTLVGMQVVKGRLVAQVEGLGAVSFHANHLPESGTSYKMPKLPVTDAWQARTQVPQAVLKQDPEIAALAAKLEELKARKAAKAEAEAKQAAKQALEAEIAALEADEG